MKQSVTSDSVSRLASASVTAAGVAHAQSYLYDQFGNMKSVTTDGSTLPLDIAGNTNRLLSSTYDPAGNMTGWPAGGYTYSAGYNHLDMMASVSGFGINRLLAYDAGGERTLIRDRNLNPLAYTTSLRGLDGKLLRELSYTPSSQSWAWRKDYIYRGSALLASVSAGEGIRHYTLDHLGSPRLVTDRCGERIDQFNAFPFGQEIVSAAQDGTEKMRFTGQERDLFSLDRTYDDIDYLHARYYTMNLGRFLSPDPLRGTPQRPQSWNLYAYVEGNPLNRMDPLGLTQDDTEVTKNSVTCDSPGNCASQITVTAPDPKKVPRIKYIPDLRNPTWAFAPLLRNWLAPLIRVLSGPAGQRSCFQYNGEEVCPELKIGIVPLLPGEVGFGLGELSETAGFELDGLSEAAGAIDRNGLTRAGRALQKHGSRSGSAFPRVRGNTELNRVGQELVDDILTSPSSTAKPNRFGGIDILASDGRGVRFDAAGQMMGFLGP